MNADSAETRHPQGAPCWRRRRALIADLCALSERQLQELGLWAGAVAATAADLLARDGCTASNEDI